MDTILLQDPVLNPSNIEHSIKIFEAYRNEYSDIYNTIVNNNLVCPEKSSFYDKRYRFYSFDLTTNDTLLKFSYDIKYDDNWQYEESRYLCNLFDALILNNCIVILFKII